MKQRIGLVMALSMATLLTTGCANANSEGKVNFKNRVLVKVNGEKILADDFEQRSTFFRQIYRSGIPFEKWTDSVKTQFQKDVLDKMIEERLVIQTARRSGISVDEKIVQNRFEAMKENFGKAFDENLKKFKKTPKDVMTDIRQGLQVEAWMQQTLVVSDSQIQACYDSLSDSLTQKEVRARHILIGLKPDATPGERETALKRTLEIKNSIESGASFEDQARKHSTCPSAKFGGDLDFFPKGNMLPAFDSAAFSLRRGELSGPVLTALGYHLIKVTDTRQKQTALAETRDVLFRRLQLRALDRLIKEIRGKSEIVYYN